MVPVLKIHIAVLPQKRLKTVTLNVLSNNIVGYSHNVFYHSSILQDQAKASNIFMGVVAEALCHMTYIR
jgi:hypothetical protein